MCGESNTYADGNSNTQRQRNTYVNHNTQTKHDAQNFSNSAPDSASAVSLGAIRSIFGNSRSNSRVLKTSQSVQIPTTGSRTESVKVERVAINAWARRSGFAQLASSGVGGSIHCLTSH